LGGGSLFTFGSNRDITGSGFFILTGVGTGFIPKPVGASIVWTKYTMMDQPVEYKTVLRPLVG
jgi:hypothetical protein